MYDDCADEYARAFHNRDTVAVDAPRLERLITTADAARGWVLDIGCSTGMHAAFFRRRGFQWVGLDIASEMFTAGRRLGVTAPFVQGDAVAVPFRSSAADLVVALESLVHLGICGLRSALAEIVRLLKPHGAALLGLQLGTGGRRVRYPLGRGQPVDVLLIDEASLAAECTESGLQLIWSERRMPLPGETRFPKLMAIVAPRAGPQRSSR